jgi:DNA-binding MarR family transcriptional regulator
MASRPPSVPPLTRDEDAFWRAFLKSLIVVPRVLFAELQEAERLDGNEYGVLVVLSEAKDRRLRMSEVASIASVSISGMTRIVDRLAKQGLVERVRAEDDTRMVIAVLTDEGLRRLKRAYPVHLAGVRRYVIDHLDGFDLGALAKAFERFGDPEVP